MWLLRQSFLPFLTIAVMVLPTVVAANSAKDISHLVQLEYGGFRLDHSTGELVQRIRLRNVSQSKLTGKLVLFINGLPPEARVANADPDFSNQAVGPKTSSNAAAVSLIHQGISPGGTADVVVRFHDPEKKPIRYQALIYEMTP